MKDQQKISHWQSLFIQQKNSGLSITDFCQQHKMATSTFYAWKKRITQIDGSNKSTTPKKQHLIPLFAEDVPEQLTSLLTLTTPAGYRLAFSDSLPHQKLNDIVRILK
jgi:hypothetical protein